MTARFITNLGVKEVSDSTFFETLFGHAPRTPAEREAEWRAEIEKWVKAIDNGFEALVPPPCLADCRRVIAEREAAECGPDPLKHLEPRRAA